MSERLHAMTDEQIGAAITTLYDELAWPAAADLATAVGTTIREQQAAPSLVAPRLRLPSRRRTLLVIAAALLALAGVALAARMVIELGAVAVQVLPGRPTALPSNVATEDNLGREVALREAIAIAGFAPELPTALGPPSRAWVDEAEMGLDPDDVAVRIVTAWSPSAGLPRIPESDAGAVLMQFRGEWEVASKLLFAETNRFGEATVEGRDAFWTSGEHELLLVSGDETRRLLVTGNVLIWQDAGFTFRLETALPKHRAIAVAESVELP
jgi:hypothetical protein